ncbi:MAG: hypothetical protein QME52_10755 [Bacteroidota bacterium]|nr:hypothetical protein [Bacteroidota bacterium]
MYKTILLSLSLLFIFFSAFSQVKLPISNPENAMSEIGSLTMQEREQTPFSDFINKMEQRQQGHRLRIGEPAPPVCPTGRQSWSGEREIPIKTQDGTNPTERQLETIKNAFTDDFLVNDDTTGGDTPPIFPSTAMDVTGNFVIVWYDYRNSNWDIYSQRYNSAGTAQGENFKVNDDAGTVYPYYSPSVVMDVSGNFVIVWQDDRNGNNDIYCQRYNSSGTAQGENFKVSDDAGTASQLSPSIAMDGSGNFVIAWMDYRNNNDDIYYQQYTSSGVAQGVNTKANDDAGTASQGSPSIAMDGSGNFVVVWMDNRNVNWDIYCQQYNSVGIVLGVNFKVNDDTGIANQTNPFITIDGSGNFVIVWMDYRNGNYDIYYQRYNTIGIAQGVNTKANDDSGTSGQSSPSIAMDGRGNFVIVWSGNRNGNSDIYSQRYNSSGVAQGVNFKVIDYAGGMYPPSVSMDGSGNYVVVWFDDRSDFSDIYSQRYNSVGAAQGIIFKVNDGTGTTHQYSPSISMYGNENFVIAWGDGRIGNSDIYYQRYNLNGIAQGVNAKVNDDAGTEGHWSPSVAMDGSGNFVIVWMDSRNGDYDIYYQRYDSSGTALGTNLKANDDSGTAGQSSPSIAMDGIGNFVIVWKDGRNDWSDIYFQRYSSTNDAIGVNTKASDDAGMVWLGAPSIAMDGSGNFAVAWGDHRNDNNDIYFQRYDSTGTPTGVNIKANDDEGTAYQVFPSLAMDGGGDFVIVWQDYRNGLYNPDVIGQRFYADGSPRGANYRIVADGPNSGEQLPVVAANGSTIVFAWEDNRRSKGWDIYAKIVGWDWEGVTSVENGRNGEWEMGSYELMQNYPNPFNPKTDIRFRIPAFAEASAGRSDFSHVALKIHDVLGREVATLVNEKKEPGEYMVTWDATGYHSGVYIYQLTVSIDPFGTGTQTITRKAILIK